MKIYVLVISIVVLLASSPQTATGQSGGDGGGGSRACPDTRATNVPAKTIHLGDTKRCGFGIRIFGIGGGIFGPLCPDKKETIPSHQECKGEVNEGTRCAFDGEISTILEDCECSEVTLFGTGLLLPKCECTEIPHDGKVEDFKTTDC